MVWMTDRVFAFVEQRKRKGLLKVLRRLKKLGRLRRWAMWRVKRRAKNIKLRGK